MAERIEKLILETEYRTTGAEQQAQRLAELQKATDGITKANLEKVAADKKVEQAANELNRTIQTQTQQATALKKGMEDASKAFNQLGQNSTVKKAFTEATAATFDFQKAIKEFQKVAQTAKSLEELAAAADEFVKALPDDLKPEFTKILDAEFKKLDKVIENPVRRLRELKRLINTTDDPELLKQLTAEAAKLEDQLGDTNDLVKALASDTFYTDTVVQGAQTAVSAFTAFQGVLALTTEDQEEFARAAAKAQGALALLQGTQQFLTEIKKADNIVTRTQIVLQRGYAAVVGTSTGAMKAFRIALAATGIGAIVLAIGALVTNWERLTEAIGLSNKELERRRDIQKKALELSAEEAAELEVMRIRINDANTSQSERVRLITELQNKYPNFLKNIDAEKVGYEEINKAIDNVNNALIKKATLEVVEDELKGLITQLRELNAVGVEGSTGFFDAAWSLFSNLPEAIAAGFAPTSDVGFFDTLFDEADKDLEENYNQTRKTIEENIKKTAQEISNLQSEVASLFGTKTSGGADATKNLVNAIIPSEEEIKKFTAGSLAAYRKDVSDLQELVEQTAPGDFQNLALEALKKAQADLAAEQQRLFGEQKAQVETNNADLTSEEERHQIAMQQIAGDSEEQILQTQLYYAKLKLQLLEASGTASEEELLKQRNAVEEIQAQIAKVTAETGERIRDEGRAKDAERRAETLAAGQQAIREATNLANTLVAIEIDKYDRLIQAQQDRVNASLEIADRGNSALVELEQKRLEDLTRQRRRFVEIQQALASAELVANTIVLVSKAAAEGGGLASAFTIAAALFSLFSGLAAARAQAQSFSFKKGGIYEGGFTGSGNPNQVSTALGKRPYEYHKGEHIMPAKVVGIGNNREWLERIRLNKIDIAKAIREPQRPVVLQQHGGSKEIVEALKNLPGITFNLNSKGIISIVESNGRKQARNQTRR